MTIMILLVWKNCADTDDASDKKDAYMYWAR